MKIKKRITIVADILVDEDFNTDYLAICVDATPDDIHETFVGQTDDFEVYDYISQEAIEINEVENE